MKGKGLLASVGICLCLILFSSILIGQSVEAKSLPVDLNISLNSENYREDLVHYQEEHFKILYSIQMVEGAEGMEEIPPEMLRQLFDLKAWVYEVDGEPGKLLSGNDWPSGTSNDFLREFKYGAEINQMIELFADSYNEAFDSGWRKRAEEAAAKYSDTKGMMQQYTIKNSPFDMIIINVIKPYLNPLSFEMEDKTILTITSMKIDMNNMMNIMGD